MKIAILAEQNFNLIDGSTIWLLNVCKLMALQSDFETDLLLSRVLENPVLANELPSQIRVVSADETLSAAHLSDTHLSPEMLVSALNSWESLHGKYDRIFVRGTGYLTQLLSAPDFRDRVCIYAPSAIPDLVEDEPDWVRLGRAARAPVVVQSTIVKRAMESLYDYPSNMVHVVPPIVFSEPAAPRVQEGPTTLCYSGKIDLHYGMDWLIHICGEISGDPDLQVSIIAGKDTYRPRHPVFFRRMDRFRADIAKGEVPGINLVTNVPHSEAKQRMERADFAYCLRHDLYDDVIEISTKIVEFCSLGVPPILNDNALNRTLFGADYPYLIDITSEDVSTRLVAFLRSRGSADYDLARSRITEIAAQFSAETLSDALGTAIRGHSLSVPALTHKPRHFLISTHERKFLSLLVDRFQADPNIRLGWETWTSTMKAAKPPKVPGQADTVFCEFCCTNAVWHSHNKRPDSKLIVRLHRFEAFREFPEQVNWGNVDTLIVVSDYLRDRMINEFNVPSERIHIWPQFINWNGLQRPKLPEAEFTLGLVGINPLEIKRLDRALDFLISLRELDDRFTLAVRSAMPWEIEWLWNRDDGPRERCEAIFERIASDPKLKNAVRFDQAGSDMEEWYRGVGVILSSSDIEGCHTAVLEGMASGCYPVVYDWPGAQSQFAPYVHTDMADAIPELLDFIQNPDVAGLRQEIAQTVKQHDVEQFAQKVMAL